MIHNKEDQTKVIESNPLNTVFEWNIPEPTVSDMERMYNNNELTTLNGNTTCKSKTDISQPLTLKEINHRWSSLPQDDQIYNLSSQIKDDQIASNNNQGIPSSTKKKKNNWKDISQIDDNVGKHQENNNGSLFNGISGLENENIHSDILMEDDPLTGLSRYPESDELYNCGIGSCRPKCARSFASTHYFMVVFLLAWILQGMYYTYFVSVITTIEKLFQIKSKITGLLMSATEIGQISTSLFLTYYAGRGHRPRWIACGMILFAFAAFGCTLPHFIYGDELLHANNVFHGGLSLGDNSSSDLNICNKQMFKSDQNDQSYNNYSGSECKEEILIEQAAHSQITSIVLIIFSISLLGVGVGQTAVSTLGIPYIDDNVASRESPIYIAITIGVRILGPAAGFILGSFCTRIYVNLDVDPGITTSDTKWVGAWWLGLVLVSSLMALTSLAMFTFPKNLRGNRIPAPSHVIEAQKKHVKKEDPPKLKDFPKTIKRQLNNDILMFRTASSVLHLLPVAGLYTFLPKYLETQFRLAAHEANFISGTGGILVMGVGIVISGIVILKFSPTARSVAAWIAFTAIVYSIGMAILMFVGCPMNDFKGLNLSTQTFEPVCNSTCLCDIEKFAPICGADNMTYFSSCHAGCKSYRKDNDKITFYNCTCIPGSSSLTSLTNDILSQDNAVSGYCGGNCTNFIIFISLFSFFVFIHSTSEVGSMLLIMRCTDPKDKAMAMGVIQFAIGLFGNVPCPIIYGAVVDSACLVWETICGKQGACSLYDGDTFRHFFLGTTAGIMFLAFLMDLVVWRKAHRIDIDPESNSTNDFIKSTNLPDTTI